MYGRAVHKKVLENQDLFSGPTIHLVNENYDEGRLLFQAKCPVRDANSAEEVASAVLKLEHYFYPRIVEGVARYL
jgi:phosphoribosylglycinamide formyltransferase-1